MNEISVKTLPLRQVPDVKSLLHNDAARMQLAAVAAKHMNPERMMRVVANAVRTTPGLQKCTPLSFLGALMQCASLGLEPNTIMGHAYLIPFNRSVKNSNGGWDKIPEVQVIIGYKGFKELARRTGQVKAMHGDVVYSDDIEFHHEYGSQQHLKHIPGPKLGKKLGAYFQIVLKNDGGEGHVYMTKTEIENIRNRSKGWQQAVKDGKTASSPWVTDEDAMWIKTPVRKLAQNGDLPMSIEIAGAQDNDETVMDYRSYALTKIEDLPDAVPLPEDEGPEDEGEAQQETAQPTQQETAKPKRTVTPRTKPAEQTADTVAPKVEAKTVEKPKPVEEQKAMDLANGDENPRYAEPQRVDGRGNPVEEDEYADVDQETGEVLTKEPEVDYSKKGIVRGIMADLKAMGFEQTMDLYADEIAGYRTTDAGLHAYLISEMAKQQ